MANGMSTWTKNVRYNGVPGVNNCPCCGSQNFLMTCFGYTYPDKTVEEWVGQCDDCNIETEDFPTESECIANWNSMDASCFEGFEEEFEE